MKFRRIIEEIRRDVHIPGRLGYDAKNLPYPTRDTTYKYQVRMHNQTSGLTEFSPQ
jgi:hypothetical protein